VKLINIPKIFVVPPLPADIDILSHKEDQRPLKPRYQNVVYYYGVDWTQVLSRPRGSSLACLLSPITRPSVASFPAGKIIALQKKPTIRVSPALIGHIIGKLCQECFMFHRYTLREYLWKRSLEKLLYWNGGQELSLGRRISRTTNSLWFGSDWKLVDIIYPYIQRISRFP